MFEIAWSELFLVIIVAIIVVGPKELPGMLRAFGRMMGKLRRSADDFRRQFEDSMRDAGGEDLQRELNALRQHNPLNEIRNTIEDAARQASAEAPRPAPPDISPASPSEPPALPAPPDLGTLPAPDAAPPLPQPPAAKAPDPTQTATPARETSSREQNGSAATHEGLANGQHRPLS